MADSEDDSSSSGGSDYEHDEAAANSDGDDNDETGDEVAVDFDSIACCQEDFHRMKPLLTQLVRKADIDISGIVDVILGQPEIGAVIKVAEPDAEPEDTVGAADAVSVPNGAASTDGAKAAKGSTKDSGAEDSETEDGVADETVYSMMSLINLTQHIKVRGIDQFIKWIASRCTPSEKAEFTDLVSKHVCGWLVNERFMNLPPQLAPPSLRSLFADVATAVADGKPFKFDYIMVVAKSIEIAVTGGSKMDEGGGSKKKRQAVSEKIFINPEDEVFQEKATFSACFALPNLDDAGGSKRHYRTVLFIPGDQVAAIMSGVDTLIPTGECKIQSL